jgi:2-oxoglutarate ferredoxin oxidoreductase subunit beta
LTEKDVKAEHVVVLEDGKPMIFGTARDKGIRLDGMTPQIVDLTKGEFSADDMWKHDERDPSPVRAFLLSQFADQPGFPTPVGVFWETQKSTYDGDLEAQIAGVQQAKGRGTLKNLLYNGNTWNVE